MRIGILGAGQLAQMLAQAGTSKLDMSFRFLSPDSDACAAPYGEQHICADYADNKALKALSDWADVITYEIESIPPSVISDLENEAVLFPPATAQAIASDRLQEKQTFQALDIPTVTFEEVSSAAGLKEAAKKTGLPAILKTRTQGYDGRGQRVLRDRRELGTAWQSLGEEPCILEAKATFKRELSIIGVRGKSGEIVCYPVTENYHRRGILRLSLPRKEDPFQHQAELMIKTLLEDLNYVGVLTLELFQIGDTLVANEIAPRVHNSGHWTIEATAASQFENHLRAVAGLPLISITEFTPVAMINLIGTLPTEDDVSAIPNASLHVYGKAPKPGRKLGHITLLEHEHNNDQFNDSITTLLDMVDEEYSGHLKS